MVDESRLAVSKAIHRRTGSTFYYATRLLPERVRHPTYVLYAFFRIADEVVDGPGDATPAEQRRRLLEIREAALGRRETDDPVLSAFSEVREAHGIPDEEVEIFVDSMLADVSKSGYDTYTELEAYMRGSAAAVGAMMTALMGADDLESALPHARALGEAFQLTNFLRDVREDIVDHGRVYLPRETLEAHGARTEDVERLRFTDEVGTAVEHELVRAERLYLEGVAGIERLPRDCQLPVLTAAVLYAEYHRLIRDRGYDTLSATVSLSARRKLSLVARTWVHWRLTDDPVAVFRRVSAVSESSHAVDEPLVGRSDPLPTD